MPASPNMLSERCGWISLVTGRAKTRPVRCSTVRRPEGARQRDARDCAGARLAVPACRGPAHCLPVGVGAVPGRTFEPLGEAFAGRAAGPAVQP
ncbi:hypothetical protein GCM10010507_63190 [Streptomyces cinnamoneus]|uniref:Uncharacterized protein n=1 Tax=Streptomyces cinnamoneus TaxID=53446 RepID=A0A919C6N3_STRCJ|nr:hypothetical protein GCM10010507_63190 [Streptomyces cinnamoneus]